MGNIYEKCSGDGKDGSDRSTQSYVCMFTLPSFVALNQRSIVERAKTLGWADELSKMSPFDRSLEADPYIEKICQKDITARGNFFSIYSVIFSYKL